MENSIGLRFKEARKKSGFTQEEVRKDLDISQSSLSQFENQENIPIYLIKYAVEKFNVNLDWLILGEGNMFKIGKGDINISDTDNLDKRELLLKVEVLTKMLEEKLLEIQKQRSIINELRSIKP